MKEEAGSEEEEEEEDSHWLSFCFWRLLDRQKWSAHNLSKATQLNNPSRSGSVASESTSFCLEMKSVLQPNSRSHKSDPNESWWEIIKK